MPSVGSEVFPSNILRVMPQRAHLKHWVRKLVCKALWTCKRMYREYKNPCLSCGIAGVPKGIPKVLSWTSRGIYNFNRQPRVTLGLGRFVWPVGLRNLLPHYDIKPGTRLVAEHETSIVIIPLCVDEKSSTKVHCIKLVVTCWRRLEVRTQLDLLRFLSLMTFWTHQQQCQGHSWPSGQALYPDDERPSWDQSVRYLWGPEEPFGICGSLFHWCQSSPDRRHRCPAHCLGRSRPYRHLPVHLLEGHIDMYFEVKNTSFFFFFFRNF